MPEEDKTPGESGKGGSELLLRNLGAYAESEGGADRRRRIEKNLAEAARKEQKDGSLRPGKKSSPVRGKIGKRARAIA